jgi:hypothetical protein
MNHEPGCPQPCTCPDYWSNCPHWCACGAYKRGRKDATRAVRELHKPSQLGQTMAICHYCDMRYPCPTIRALDGAQE